ncbi:hypothetical protein GOODEAATRI_003133, partial [Goodea atripinnis]
MIYEDRDYNMSCQLPILSSYFSNKMPHSFSSTVKLMSTHQDECQDLTGSNMYTILPKVLAPTTKSITSGVPVTSMAAGESSLVWRNLTGLTPTFFNTFG